MKRLKKKISSKLLKRKSQKLPENINWQYKILCMQEMYPIVYSIYLWDVHYNQELMQNFISMSGDLPLNKVILIETEDKIDLEQYRHLAEIGEAIRVIEKYPDFDKTISDIPNIISRLKNDKSLHLGKDAQLVFEQKRLPAPLTIGNALPQFEPDPTLAKEVNQQLKKIADQIYQFILADVQAHLSQDTRRSRIDLNINDSEQDWLTINQVAVKYPGLITHVYHFKDKEKLENYYIISKYGLQYKIKENFFRIYNEEYRLTSSLYDRHCEPGKGFGYGFDFDDGLALSLYTEHCIYLSFDTKNRFFPKSISDQFHHWLANDRQGECFIHFNPLKMRDYLPNIKRFNNFSWCVQKFQYQNNQLPIPTDVMQYIFKALIGEETLAYRKKMKNHDLLPYKYSKESILNK